MKTITKFLVACFFFLCASGVSATNHPITKVEGVGINLPAYAEDDVLTIHGDTLESVDWTVLKGATTKFHLVLETENKALPVDALRGNGTLVKSVVANKLISIGTDAFRDNKTLEYVIAKKLKTIGEDAFRAANENLRFVSFPEVENILVRAFEAPAQTLKIMELGSTAPSVGTNFFWDTEFPSENGIAKRYHRIILVPEGTDPANYAAFIAAAYPQVIHLIEKVGGLTTVELGSSKDLTSKVVLPFVDFMAPWGGIPDLQWYKDGAQIGSFLKIDGSNYTGVAGEPLFYTIGGMTPTDEGTYTLQFSLVDGNYSPYMLVPLAEFQVGIGTSINEVEASNLISFNSGIITFSADVTAYEIYSLSGQLIKTGTQSTISLDKGAYIIKAIGTQATQVKKIIW